MESLIDSNDIGSPQKKETRPIYPSPWRASLWAIVLFVLSVIGAVLYISGYGGYLGYQSAISGMDPDPLVIEAQIEAHLETITAFAGMYIVQALLVLPVLLAISSFANQSRKETLAWHRFPISQLKRWLPILAVFYVFQYFVAQVFEIDPGDFMRSLVGQQHLIAALVIVFLAPLVEELVFRGYLYKAWRHTWLGFTGTLLLTSALFTAMHLGQYGWVQLAIVFGLALLCGIAREKSGTVLLPIVLHSTSNLVGVILVMYLGIL